jgi:hypothetical protein
MAVILMVSQSNVKHRSRYDAVESVIRKLQESDYAEVGMDIQIRVNGDNRTITVRTDEPEQLLK